MSRPGKLGQAAAPLTIVLAVAVLTSCASTVTATTLPTGGYTAATTTTLPSGFIDIPPRLIAGAPALPGAVTSMGRPSQQAPALLTSTPSTGPVGTRFTLSGSGLPKNEKVQIVWSTWNGSYAMAPSAAAVAFYAPQFTPIGVDLADTRTDSQGNLSFLLTAPEDYGSIHDIYAVANGIQVAKGGFELSRSVTITPTRGQLGTPITIRVTGAGASSYVSTLSVLYDNHYSGFISATTTRGTAVVHIRAAGTAGRHEIEVDAASAAVPYLNIQQSPVAYVGSFRFTFTVTKDSGPPRETEEWPAVIAPSQVMQSTLSGAQAAAPGVSAHLSTGNGPVGSAVVVTASGLAARTPVTLGLTTAIGNHLSGYTLSTSPLAQTTTGDSGSLTTRLTIPDPTLGGWHAIEVVQGGNIEAELPYYIDEILVGVTPTTVKEGHTFTVHLEGLGSTDINNGVAVDYDNSYIGYACGFNSEGDDTINLVATGGPGTHLIDVYPMIYEGEGPPAWDYEVPQLSFSQDAPGLALGFRLPAFRLAIKVIR